MFERLFGSKTRVKMLKLFLLHPEEKFLFSEITKSLKLLPSVVKKELDNLEKFGLVYSGNPAELNEISDILAKPRTEIKQEKRFYQVNAGFILFDELKALLLKAQMLYERDFIDKLVEIGKIKLLILTGIFVNETLSPIDLLIVGHLNKPKLVKLLKELEVELGKEINFTHLETAEFVYRRNVTDVFLYEILEKKKIVVIDELSN